MVLSERFQRVPQFWLVQILGWFGYAGIDIADPLSSPTDRHALIISHGIFFSSLFVASLVLRLAYRQMLKRNALWPNTPWPRTMLQAGLLVCLMALPCGTLAEWSWIRVKGNPFGRSYFVAHAWEDVIYAAVLLVAWSALYLGIKHYQAFQAEHKRAVKAEALARDARLQALRYQLNPHFLFNTLNAISTLVVRGESAGANRMLVQLAGFLRSTLDGLDEQEIPLSREMANTEQYLEIERARLGHRLELDLSVALEVRGGLVPPLLLQPLVENAIRHGIAPNPEGGRLTIRADRHVGRIRLTISDNGSGGQSDERRSGIQRRGVGLSITIERLRVLYGADHRLVVYWPPEGGCRIEMELPYKEEVSIVPVTNGENACVS